MVNLIDLSLILFHGYLTTVVWGSILDLAHSKPTRKPIS